MSTSPEFYYIPCSEFRDIFKTVSQLLEFAQSFTDHATVADFGESMRFRGFIDNDLRESFIQVFQAFITCEKVNQIHEGVKIFLLLNWFFAIRENEDSACLAQDLPEAETHPISTTDQLASFLAGYEAHWRRQSVPPVTFSGHEKKYIDVTEAGEQLVLRDLIDCCVFIRQTYEQVVISDCRECEFVFCELVGSAMLLRKLQRCSVSAVVQSLHATECHDLKLFSYTRLPLIISGSSSDVKLAPFNVAVSPTSPVYEHAGRTWRYWTGPLICGQGTKHAELDPTEFNVVFSASNQSVDINQPITMVPLPGNYAQATTSIRQSIIELQRELLIVEDTEAVAIARRILTAEFKRWTLQRFKTPRAEDIQI